MLKISGIVLLALLSLFFWRFLWLQYVYTGEIRSHKELADFFMQNQDKFDSINSKILKFQDMGLKGISYSETTPENLAKIGLTEEEINELNKEIDEIKFPDGHKIFGVLWDLDGVLYLTHSWGIVTAGGAEGYYYAIRPIHYSYEGEFSTSEEEIRAIYMDPKILDSDPRTYKKIIGNWYLYEISN